MRRRNLTKASGPYRVDSCADGTLTIRPEWTQFEKYDPEKGGGPGLFSRLQLADEIELLREGSGNSAASTDLPEVVRVPRGEIERRWRLRARKRPVEVEAIQWVGGIGTHLESVAMLNEFCGRNWARADVVDEVGPDDIENVVVWNTKERQWLNVPVGHWIIRGVQGELYPCASDVFEQTYEIVE